MVRVNAYETNKNCNNKKKKILFFDYLLNDTSKIDGDDDVVDVKGFCVVCGLKDRPIKVTSRTGTNDQLVFVSLAATRYQSFVTKPNTRHDSNSDR